MELGTNSWNTNEVTNYTFDKEVDKTEAKIGEELTYTINYKNIENETTDITIVDKLAEGLTYVEGSATKDGVYNKETHTVTWVIQDVAAKTDGEVSFKATVNEKAIEVINNVASIQVGNNPEISVDTDTVETEVFVPEKPNEFVEEAVVPSAPKTGDSSSAAIWSTLTFASIVVCGAILIIEKKRRNEI